MRFKFVSATAVAALSISLLSATGASGSTEFGDTCVGENFAGGDYTLTTRLGSSPALPLTAPASGVVTKVRMLVGRPLPTTIPMAVKLLRSAGGKSFTVTSQMTMQVAPGFNLADARMPVQVGERLALQGLPFTSDSPSFEYDPSEGISFFCREGAPGVIGGTVSPTPVGSTAEYSAEVGSGRVPLAAIIEPDADNDGFGDETQDACPRSPAIQAVVCPPVVLSTTSHANKGSVTVVVASSTAAPVSVSGLVKLGKSNATLDGGTQTLTPGALGKFTLKFGKKLKTKLKDLSRKKSLALNVTVSGTSVSGAVTTSALKIRLKGQAKP